MQTPAVCIRVSKLRVSKCNKAPGLSVRIVVPVFVRGSQSGRSCLKAKGAKTACFSGWSSACHLAYQKHISHTMDINSNLVFLQCGVFTLP